MAYPDNYPERYKESIFAWSSPESAGTRGALEFVVTRAGDHLKVYVFQYLGHAESEDLPDEEWGGDVYLPCNTGTIDDIYYNPDDDDSFLPEDMRWHGEKPRLSQPVRDWLRTRDMIIADRDSLLAVIASDHRFDPNNEHL